MANRIACGFSLAERQQDHFGSPMAVGARDGKRRERVRGKREKKRKGEEVEGEDQAGPATMTSRASNRE